MARSGGRRPSQNVLPPALAAALPLLRPCVQPCGAVWPLVDIRRSPGDAGHLPGAVAWWDVDAGVLPPVVLWLSESAACPPAAVARLAEDGRCLRDCVAWLTDC